MEDRDTERRNALMERRIRRVEYLVNTFRIAGQGLTGGYPLSRLKEGQSYTHGERIADLGNRFAGFDLRGTNGVQVSGGMQHGFVAQMEVEEEEEEETTPVTCPDHSATVYFTVEGLIFDCGCVGGQWIYTDGNVNGATIPITWFDVGGVWANATYPEGDLTYFINRRFFFDFDCPSGIFEDDTAPLFVSAECIDGAWDILIQSQGGLSLFDGVGEPGSLIVFNTRLNPNPCSDYGGGAPNFATAHDGTVTIEIVP